MPRSELSYRFEPHDHIPSVPRAGVADDDTVAAGGGVPGVVGLGWAGEGYTGYYPGPSPDPIFSIF